MAQFDCNPWLIMLKERIMCVTFSIVLLSSSIHPLFHVINKFKNSASKQNLCKVPKQYDNHFIRPLQVLFPRWVRLSLPNFSIIMMACIDPRRFFAVHKYSPKSFPSSGVSVSSLAPLLDGTEGSTLPSRVKTISGTGTPSAAHVTLVSWLIQDLIVVWTPSLISGLSKDF